VYLGFFPVLLKLCASNFNQSQQNW